MAIITVKLNNPINAKKVPVRKKKSSSVFIKVFEKPIVAQENIIIKPSPPVISNDVNMSLVFQPNAIFNAIFNAKANYNAELKLDLLQKLAPLGFKEFEELINIFSNKLLVDEKNGLLTDIFYNTLNVVYNKFRNNKISDAAYSKEFFEKHKNIDVSFVVFNNNFTNTVGRLSPEPTGYTSPLFKGLVVPLSGKDALDTNSQGLALNEQFKIFFFNSERYQEVTPGDTVGDDLEFIDKGIVSIINLSLGKNQLKV